MDFDEADSLFCFDIVLSDLVENGLKFSNFYGICMVPNLGPWLGYQMLGEMGCHPEISFYEFFTEYGHVLVKFNVQCHLEQNLPLSNTK